MGYGNFKLNGVDIKNPSKFKIERYKVTDLVRLANADMTGNLIARKLKFLFTYDAIDSNDFDTILDVIWDASGIFYTLTYTENGESKSAEVYPGAIPSDLHSAHSSKWVWKDVSFNLIER